MFDKYPLTIGFVGGIRYFDINKKIISAFANSTRFNLLYVGKMHPGCDLEDFCTVHGITNAKFSPAYINEDKPTIYKKIDIINSVYGNSTLEVRTALPNKLYDAALYKKPILVSKNTYLHEIVSEYNLGLAIDFDKTIDKTLIDYISQFDKAAFIKGCENFLKLAYTEQQIARVRVDEFIKALKHGGQKL